MFIFIVSATAIGFAMTSDVDRLFYPYPSQKVGPQLSLTTALAFIAAKTFTSRNAHSCRYCGGAFVKEGSV